MKKAFTLIELLIVVAIIAILAAIAVPNFLEAQVRAKVSRAKSDLRVSALALESYFVDNNSYPPANRAIALLSTPISYVTNAGGRDPFGVGRALPGLPPDVFGYTNLMEQRWLTTIPALVPTHAGQQALFQLRWLNISRGPDNDLEVEDRAANFATTPVSLATYFNGLISSRSHYDPTNGTVSEGDITISQRGFLSGGLL
jgi:type II secretion system protein G